MKRILVAEDHDSIAATYKLFLESELLCEVVITRDGQECIETYDNNCDSANSGNSNSINEQRVEDASRSERTGTSRARSSCSMKNDNDTPFDLVVLDYHLPYKDGIEVAEHILSVNPHQRILIASSYPREIIVRSAEVLNRSIELMLKPFELEDFARTVEGLKQAEIIDGIGH